LKLYLDACCLSRLTDDQSQPRIRLVAQAIERILGYVRIGKVNLISSEALVEEARRTGSVERRAEVETLLSLASEIVLIDEAIERRAHELYRDGYGLFDALHLAAAESIGVDALLSTDDRFVKRAARAVGRPRIIVRNPVSWCEERQL
jgi:predicted nucleic acid-binding protein